MRASRAANAISELLHDHAPFHQTALTISSGGVEETRGGLGRQMQSTNNEMNCQVQTCHWRAIATHICNKPPLAAIAAPCHPPSTTHTSAARVANIFCMRLAVKKHARNASCLGASAGRLNKSQSDVKASDKMFLARKGRREKGQKRVASGWKALPLLWHCNSAKAV